MTSLFFWYLGIDGGFFSLENVLHSTIGALMCVRFLRWICVADGVWELFLLFLFSLIPLVCNLVISRLVRM